ncbi:MAG: hypothetical protein DIJKHBIC_01833 [Thermoanaerobaculia bacterium]|nr:hypothetical protein [Thermoanaerobaculia bacterium]
MNSESPSLTSFPLTSNGMARPVLSRCTVSQTRLPASEAFWRIDAAAGAVPGARRSATVISRSSWRVRPYVDSAFWFASRIRPSRETKRMTSFAWERTAENLDSSRARTAACRMCWARSRTSPERKAHPTTNQDARARFLTLSSEVFQTSCRSTETATAKPGSSSLYAATSISRPPGAGEKPTSELPGTSSKIEASTRLGPAAAPNGPGARGPRGRSSLRREA